MGRKGPLGGLPLPDVLGDTQGQQLAVNLYQNLVGKRVADIEAIVR